MIQPNYDGFVRLLLITGAGASRNLAPDGSTLSLMTDWARHLCTALDEREAGLAGACGLRSGASGPAFEESLGLLLRWAQMQHFAERFKGLGGPSLARTPITRSRRSTTLRAGCR